MQIKPLKIGNKTIENNVFLAPMAGYTDYAFRSLELNQGVGFCFTELVSAKGLFYGAGGTKNLLYIGNNENDKTDFCLNKEKTAVQLFGADPYYMHYACESDELKNFDIVDINMGCPVLKVYKNGEGSALLNDIKKAEDIIKECVKSGKIITVKIRIGIKDGDDIAEDFAKMAEGAGASLITIHGRVRDAYYSGEPNYFSIAKAKKSVKIPVIANGGIFSVEDADRMINETGADGIMIARGAVDNPFLANNLLKVEQKETLKQFAISQLNKMEKLYGAKRAVLEFRKFIPHYIKHVNSAKQTRIDLMTKENINEIKEKLNEVL